MKKISQKKRKTINRSGTFPCDVCGEQHILDTHHIEGRDIPDANNINNLTNICPNCHRLAHEGVIVIEGWFNSTGGRVLLYHKCQEESFSGQAKTPFIIPRSVV